MDFDSQSVLITGATGFVGSHLARRLLLEGAAVHLLLRPKSAVEFSGARLNLHIHDGSMQSMIDIVERAKPTITFHLASLFLAEHQPGDIPGLISSNVALGTQLLETLANHAASTNSTPAKFINTGTSWQHFHNADRHPVNLYAATKQAFDCICDYYVERGQIDAITLKLFDTYGPEDRRKKLFAMLRRAAVNAAPLAMSPGEQMIDLVYIDDVVDAYLAAANLFELPLPARHRDYAISSRNPLPLRQIVDIYQRAVGHPLPIQWGARPYRSREVMVPWNTGRPLPNWTPRVSLVEGIRRLVEEPAPAPRGLKPGNTMSEAEQERS